MMTNQQILTKAIQKAIDGGWKIPCQDSYDSYYVHQNRHGVFVVLEYKENGEKFVRASRSAFDIIFDHNFAKAIWGTADLEKYVRISGSNQLVETVAWVHHLQQMVIAEDPIKYLGENI